MGVGLKCTAAHSIDQWRNSQTNRTHQTQNRCHQLPTKESKTIIKILTENNRKYLVQHSLPGCNVMISSEELSSPSRTEMHFDPVTTYTALTNRVSPGGSARGLCSPSPAGRERERGREWDVRGREMCEGEERGSRCVRERGGMSVRKEGREV
jgi:hypothetical protein